MWIQSFFFKRIWINTIHGAHKKGNGCLEGMVWKHGAYPSPTTDLLLFVYIESLDVQLGPAVFGNERNKLPSKAPWCFEVGSTQGTSTSFNILGIQTFVGFRKLLTIWITFTCSGNFVKNLRIKEPTKIQWTLFHVYSNTPYQIFTYVSTRKLRRHWNRIIPPGRERKKKVIQWCNCQEGLFHVFKL